MRINAMRIKENSSFALGDQTRQRKMLALFHCVVFFAVIHLFLGPVAKAAGGQLPMSSAPAHLRIVSLNPALTEILFALGLGDSVVGVSDFTDFPEPAKKIISVGSYYHPNLEKIISLKPDVVIDYKEGLDFVSEALKKAHIELLTLEARSLADFEKIVKVLGQKFAVSTQAEELLAAWKEGWGKLNPPGAKRGETILVALQVDHEPVFVAGGDTFISEVATKCGFENAFAEKKGYVQLNTEALSLKRKLLVIGFPPFSSKRPLDEITTDWMKWSHSKFYFFTDSAITRLSPRLPQLAQKLCDGARKSPL